MAIRPLLAIIPTLHKMKTKLSAGTLLLITIITIPIITNTFIGLNTPFSIKVSGSETDWVSFFGSYLGGVLTAIIGYITLYYNTKQSEKTILVSQKTQTIKELEQTLANCVSLFDYSKVGKISLFFDSPSKYDDVLQELDSYLDRIATTANAWGVIYANSEQQVIRDFQDTYTTCVSRLVEKINEVTKEIIALKIACNEQERTAVISRINEIIAYKDTYLSLLQDLFTKAQLWIKQEKQELRQIQKA